MAILENARVKIGRPGPPGSGVTLGEKTSITDRLTALEAVVVPDTITDLTDVDLTGIAANDLLRWDGTKFVKYTPEAITQTFLLPFLLDGGGDAIAAATYFESGVPVPSACEITGWYVRNSTSSTIVTSIQRCPAGSSTWTTISGSEGPGTSSAAYASDTNLTTWTVTEFGALDSFRVVVASGTAVATTVALLLERTL